MRNFSGGGRFSGGRNDRNDRGDRGGFKPRRFGGDDRGERQMFGAVCDNCGKHCEVPFKPTGEKPVYCSDCFEDMGNGRDRQYNDNDTYGNKRNDRNDRGRNDSYASSASSGSGISDKQFQEFVYALDKKLDMVIDLLTLIAEKKTVRIGKPAPTVLPTPEELKAEEKKEEEETTQSYNE